MVVATGSDRGCLHLLYGPRWHLVLREPDEFGALQFLSLLHVFLPARSLLLLEHLGGGLAGDPGIRSAHLLKSS